MQILQRSFAFQLLANIHFPNNFIKSGLKLNLNEALDFDHNWSMLSYPLYLSITGTEESLL